MMSERSMRYITVFCGSNKGHSNAYAKVSKTLIDALYEQKISLIYGGTQVGLMGIIADHMLSKGGDVIGIIPEPLVDIELAHENLTQLHVVKSMHERKARMEALSDGFVMLPGGAGSLDEFFEMFTWAQLSFHSKPCAILNIDGYFNHLLNFLDHAVTQGFLSAAHRDMIIVDDVAEKLVNKMIRYQTPVSRKNVSIKNIVTK